MSRSIRFLLALGAITIGLAACGDDDESPTGGGGPTTAKFNAAWQGVWTVHFLAVSCVGGDTLINSNTAAVFCDGENFVFNPFDVPITCEGSVTNTVIDVDCDTTFTSDGCDVRVETDLNVVRSGETFTGTGSSTLQVSGCAFDTTGCVNYTIEGVRVGDGVAECAVAASRANVFNISRIVWRQ